MIFLSIDEAIAEIEKNESEFKEKLKQQNVASVRSEVLSNKFLLSIRVNKFLAYNLFKLYGNDTKKRNEGIRDLINNSLNHKTEENAIKQIPIVNSEELDKLKKENETLKNAFIQLYRLFIGENILFNTERDFNGTPSFMVLWDDFVKLVNSIDTKLIDSLKLSIIGDNSEKIKAELMEVLK